MDYGDVTSILAPQKAEGSVYSVYKNRDVLTIAESCFTKKYKLDVSKFELPDVNTLFSQDIWKDSRLQELKTKLNMVKNKLNDFDQDTWHEHTNFTNPAYNVLKCLRTNFKVEFSTQAWCKFHELVNMFNLIPESCKEVGTLTTVHLCEAPGAFVTSLNHYIRTHIPDIQWLWIANSLNPFYEGNNVGEMIQDDRLMIHTLGNWYFGPDCTGDVKHPTFHFELRRNIRKQNMPKPLLVTADGSMDCQDKPEEQELIVSQLHRKEALTAMELLDEGGTLILKMFTLFECDSICLIYLLSCLFNFVDIVKPATSKEGNSECYVVCREYKGHDLASPYIKKILEYERNNAAIFPYSVLPTSFLDQIFNCSSFFTSLQMEAINRNIMLYYQRKTIEFIDHLDKIHKLVCTEYVRRNRISKLPESMRITSPTNNVKLVSVNESRNSTSGSFTEKRRLSCLVGNKFLSAVMNDLESLHAKISSIVNTTIALEKGRSLPLKALDIKLGKPIEQVNSSQFCYAGLMRLRNKLISKYGLTVYRDFMGKVIKSSCKEPIPVLRASTVYSELPFDKATHKTYKTLYRVLKRTREDRNIGIDGFPLLTQFNVNLICILREMFDTIEFVPPCLLLLKNYRVERQWLRNMKLIMKYLDHFDSCHIMSFLPLRCITENTFRSFIVDVNNAMVSEEITLFCTKNNGVTS